MFKNFRFYRIHSDWPADEASLNEALAGAAFKPCPAYSEKSVGFEPPIEILEDLLCRRLSGVDLLQLRYQTKLLPPSVLKEALAERVIDFERRTARPPARGGRRAGRSRSTTGRPQSRGVEGRRRVACARRR